ncbi:4-hydroxy-tetrahydrodipicolinate synthase [archaeon HR06]|nr:4-hydroxy-tetrahydrodipicolinate synthase [archaeon HR06]
MVNLREYIEKGVVLVVQLTPFKSDEEIDYEGLRTNTQFLVEKGGPLILTPCGSTGEFYALNDEEWKKVVKLVIDEVNGKLPVVVGASAAGTKACIEKCKYAEDLGANGVMVVLPYYHVPDEEGLYLHYKRIAESINISLVIYNNPDVSKIYMKPKILRKLAGEFDNIVCVKENTPYIPLLDSQVRESGLPILQGRGEWWFGATYILGVKGYVSGYANYMPDFSLELLKAGLKKDHKKVEELMNKLYIYESYLKEISNYYSPSTTILPPPYMDSTLWLSFQKASMNILGLKGGKPRLPIRELKEEHIKGLREILIEKLNLKPIG